MIEADAEAVAKLLPPLFGTETEFAASVLGYPPFLAESGPVTWTVPAMDSVVSAVDLPVPSLKWSVPLMYLSAPLVNSSVVRMDLYMPVQDRQPSLVEVGVAPLVIALFSATVVPLIFYYADPRA